MVTVNIIIIRNDINTMIMSMDYGLWIICMQFLSTIITKRLILLIQKQNASMVNKALI